MFPYNLAREASAPFSLTVLLTVDTSEIRWLTDH